MLWFWPKSKKFICKSGASKLFNAHGKVLAARLNGGLRLPDKEGFDFALICMNWDCSANIDVVAKSLKKDGFLPEVPGVALDDEMTTDPESEELEDLASTLSRAAGCITLRPTDASFTFIWCIRFLAAMLDSVPIRLGSMVPASMFG